MNAIWVLVAERSRARLFELDAATAPLQEIKDWVETRARLRPGDYETTEAPGRTFNSWGVQRHAMEMPTDPHDKAAQGFAAELVAFLDGEYERQRFDKLILVASPRMLGTLHQELSDKLRRTVAAEVPKSLAKRSPKTIRAHLPTPPVYPEPTSPST